MLETYGEPPADISFELEQVNFGLFTAYTPINTAGENGIKQVGILGTFIQVSEGQFDYPWWLDATKQIRDLFR